MSRVPATPSATGRRILTGARPRLAADPGDLDAAIRRPAPSRACATPSATSAPPGPSRPIAASGLRGRGGAGYPDRREVARRRGAAGRASATSSPTATAPIPAVHTDAALWPPTRGRSSRASRSPRSRSAPPRRSSPSGPTTRRSSRGSRARSLAAEEAGFLGDDVLGSRPPRHGDGPARPGRVHAGRGDGPAQGARGQARPARAAAAVPDRDAACSASPPSSTTSRRWPPSRGSCARARRRSRRSAPRTARARSSSSSAGRPAAGSPRCRWAPRCASSSQLAGGTGHAQPQGGPRRRPDGRPAAGGPARHCRTTFDALREAGAHVGSGSVVIADDRAVRRRPRPAADPLLGRRGVRQDDPLPDRPAPPVRDRRPRRDRHARSPPTPALLADLAHDVAASGAVRPRAPGDPRRSPAGCDTSGPSSTTTSSAAPAPPASVTPIAVGCGRDPPGPADGRPDHPPRGPASSAARRRARTRPAVLDTITPRDDTLAERLITTQARSARRARRAIRIEVDGRVVEGFEGQTILEVCRDNGIEIPTLCYEPKLPGFGACRMCVVRGRGRGPPADLLLARGRGRAWSSRPRPRSCAGCAGRTSS